MTIDRLRGAVKAAPFRQFYVCLADGRRFKVSHPERILITPDAARTFVLAERGEDYRIIDLLLVSSIDCVNGHPRRRSIH